MDNITHTIVGLGVGALIDRSLPAEPDAPRVHTRQRMLLTVCALASNFPDLDLLYSNIIPAPLGYLLHHRGHTHTLLAGCLEVILLLALVWVLWPNARRLLKTGAAARRGAVSAACTGLLLHLSMDAMNVYGRSGRGTRAGITATWCSSSSRYSGLPSAPHWRRSCRAPGCAGCCSA
jgi:inner membrane protein